MIKLAQIPLRTWFYITISATFMIRILVAAVVPILSEEAFFVVWAEHPDFGYYDHGPMVAWLVHPFLYLGKTEVFVRFPAIISSPLIGLGIVNILKPYDRDKAYLLGIFFLVSPVYLFNVFITHNTPLEIFAFFSGLCVFKAITRPKMRYYALSGICLGLAFLSKYLAVPLGAAYFLYWFFSKKEKHQTIGFSLLYLCLLPFVFVHFYWNYTHCWYTVNFHFFNRHPETELSLEKFFTYVITLVYLVSPPVIYFFIKNIQEFRKNPKIIGFGILIYAFLFPTGFFLLFAFKVIIGLHWVMGYFPFLYVLLYLYLERSQFKPTIQFAAYFSMVHFIVIVGSALIPLQWWEKPLQWRKMTEVYPLVAFVKEKKEILAQLEKYKGKFLFTTYDYTASSLSTFETDYYFATPGYEGFHSRQDDIITDWRKYDGKDLLILLEFKKDAKIYTDYFDSTEIKQFKYKQFTYYYLLGYNFHYQRYKKLYLTRMKEKFYTLPPFLPMKSCAFLENYFPEDWSKMSKN